MRVLRGDSSHGTVLVERVGICPEEAMEHVRIGITGAWHQLGSILGKALTVRALVTYGHTGVLLPKKSDHSELLLCSKRF